MVGVAEHTLAHPHMNFEHDITFHSLIFNKILKKNRGGQFWVPILYFNQIVFIQPPLYEVKLPIFRMSDIGNFTMIVESSDDSYLTVNCEFTYFNVLFM